MPTSTSMDSRAASVLQNAMADAVRLKLNGGTLELYALGTNGARPMDGNASLAGYALLSTHSVSCATAAVGGQFTITFGAATPSAGTPAFAVYKDSGGVRQMDVSIGATALFNIEVPAVPFDGSTSVTPTAVTFAMPALAF